MHKCYQKFDPNFNGYVGGNNNKGGYSRNGNFSRGNNNMQVMLATPENNSVRVRAWLNNSVRDGAWFPDSGATNYVTNDLANLNLGTEYQGSNRLQMGNGTGALSYLLGLEVHKTENGDLHMSQGNGGYVIGNICNGDVFDVVARWWKRDSAPIVDLCPCPQVVNDMIRNKELATRASYKQNFM
ncbi:hypothetical protein LWI29_017546 [Acer saccharum]|uniref:Uncharacterized protein n=1 Tax=Acer saccharum TaxID=4024 RepID=A0AA39SYL6_ACESA|nr:hypothetical protein LWI29_017546 [Acer saccharum]